MRSRVGRSFLAVDVKLTDIVATHRKQVAIHLIDVVEKYLHKASAAFAPSSITDLFGRLSNAG